MSPRVSVVMPAFNVADFIGQSLGSVLAQTFTDLEVVVVDDASTDGTAELEQRFDDPRIRWLRNAGNRGAGYTRNRAIAESRGEWLALLDADDAWLPERLESLLSVAQAGDSDLLADDVLLHDAELRPLGETALGKRGVRLEGPTRASILELVRWDLGFLKPMIRRRFLLDSDLRFDESLRHGEEDFELMWRCLRRGARFDLLPAGYYLHRSRPGSLTSHRLRLFEASRATTLGFLAEVEGGDPELTSALRERLRRIDHTLAYNRSRLALRDGAPAKAVRALLDSPGACRFAAGQLWRGLRRKLTPRRAAASR